MNGSVVYERVRCSVLWVSEGQCVGLSVHLPTRRHWLNLTHRWPNQLLWWSATGLFFQKSRMAGQMSVFLLSNLSNLNRPTHMFFQQDLVDLARFRLWKWLRSCQIWQDLTEFQHFFTFVSLDFDCFSIFFLLDSRYFPNL